MCVFMLNQSVQLLNPQPLQAPLSYVTTQDEQRLLADTHAQLTTGLERDHHQHDAMTTKQPSCVLPIQQHATGLPPALYCTTDEHVKQTSLLSIAGACHTHSQKTDA